MANIDKIKLYNFKAFYGEETIELGGKHLLLYGENGSGKSSIYWALYTLLQSSTKPITEVQKYFEPKNEQNLINTNHIESLTYTETTSGKKIYPDSVGLNANAEIILEGGASYLVDSRGLTVYDIGALKNLNRHSDFISHRLLINFYNYRNSRQINLWEVFVRDMFPYLKTNKGANDKTLSEELKEIEVSLPYFYKTKAGKKVFSVKKSDKSGFTGRLTVFNDDLEYWITQINTYVNIFYEANFKDTADREIEISLKLERKFDFLQGYDQAYKYNNEDYFRYCNYSGFSEPIISLNIKIRNVDGTFTPIPKPQSYFNEAKLTSIGLAVRFTLLLEFIRPDFEGKFLALDDLLVSLDMSNRDKVLDIILNVFAPKYKIYLFTHERSFFNLVKRQLTNRNLLDDWKINEVFMNDFENPQKPKIVNSEDYLSKALFHLKNFDLPASANYLRKECEVRMKYLLPENLAKTAKDNEETKYKLLENMLTSFIKYFSETLHQDISKFLLLKEKKDLFLNPLSHDNLDSEIYKDELLQFHNLLLELRLIKKAIILKSDDEFTFDQIDSNDNIRKYKVRVNENLMFYKNAEKEIIIKNCKCEFLSYDLNNSIRLLSQEVKFKDIQKVAYKHAVNSISTNPYPDFLDEYKNENLQTFRVLLNASNF